jgi:hypothetical protein
LSPIHSLAYFAPVIEELLHNPVPDTYIEYLRRKMQSFVGKKVTGIEPVPTENIIAVDCSGRRKTILGFCGLAVYPA